MASSKASKVAKQHKVNTRWLNNVVKSIGGTAGEVFSEMAPNITTVAKAGITKGGELASSLRSGTSSINRVQGALSSNKYVQFAKKGFDNAIRDLKSGNFNNKEAEDAAMMGSFDMGADLDSMFDDGSFGDFDIDSGSDINIFQSAGGDGGFSAASLVTDEIKEQTRVTLETSKASLNASVAMTSTVLTEMKTLSSQITGHLSNMESHLSALVEFNNQNFTKFIENATGYFERMGSLQESYGSSNDGNKTNAANIFSSDGSMDLSSYKSALKKNLSDALGPASLMASFLTDDMLEMLMANPLGMMSKFVVGSLVPKTLKTAITGVESTFSKFLPAFFDKLAVWGENETGATMPSMIKKLIGKTFGVRNKRATLSGAGAVSKDATPFDKVTRIAITEIIPKELREQTSYLKAIAEHFKVDTNKAVNESEKFIYGTGEWTKVSDIQKNIAQQLFDSVADTFKQTDFGKLFLDQTDKIKNADDRKDMEDLLKNFFFEINKTNKFINWRNYKEDESDPLNTILSNLDGGKHSKRSLSLLKKMIDNFVKDGKDSVLMGASAARYQATAAENRIKEDINEDPSYWGLYDTTYGKKDINGDEIDEDEVTLRTLGYSAGRLKDIDEKRKKKRKKTKNEEKNRRRRATRLAGRNDSEISDKEFAGIMGRKKKKKDNEDEDILTQFENKIKKFKEGKKGSDDKSSFGDFVKSTGESISGFMADIVFGKQVNVADSVANIISDTTKKAWDALKKNFFEPVKFALIGEKDGEGNRSGGIFSTATNKFKDLFRAAKYQLTGDEYTDSEGTKHEKKSGLFGTFKEALTEKFFGTKKVDKDGNPTGKREGGMFGTVIQTLKDGVEGWKTAIFGEENTEEEKKKVEEKFKEALPNGMAGATVGGGLGLLGVGFLNPILGVGLGFTTGLLSKSESFQKMLFGEEEVDEKGNKTGNRIGGIINQNVQKYLKDRKNPMIAGALTGAVSGGLGIGLLGNIAGGPVVGALLGTASSLAIKSETFQKFLYGESMDKDKGEGFVGAMKKMFQRKDKDEKQAKSDAKTLGMGAVGAGAGAIGGMIAQVGIMGTMMSPIGPIGGALLGLAATVKASGGRFKEYLFGKDQVDEKGNKVHTHGLFGRFGNMLKVSVLNPLKNRLGETAEDIRINFNWALQTAGNAFLALIEPIKNKVTEIKDAIVNKVKGAGKILKDIFVSPIIKIIHENVINPIKTVVGGIASILYKGAKSVVLFPFKIAHAIVKTITNPFVKAGKKVKDIMVKGVKKFFGKALSLLGKGIKGIFKVATAPLRLAARGVSFVKDKLDARAANRDPREKASEGTDIWTRIKDARERQKIIDKDKKIELQNARDKKKANKLHEKNSVAIAKATNYQLTEDTLENRRIAMANGAKIRTDVRAIDDLTEEEKKKKKAKISEEAMGKADIGDIDDPQERQVSVLVKILNVLKGKNPDGSDKESSDESGSDDKPKYKLKDGKYSTADTEDGTEEDKPETNPYEKGTMMYYKWEADHKKTKIGTLIDKAKGKINSFGKKHFGFELFGGNKPKEDDESEETSDTSAEVNPEAVEGANAFSNIVSQIYQNFKGNAYAEGTDGSDDESAIVGEKGTEIVVNKDEAELVVNPTMKNLKKGNQVIPTNKPINVFISGIAKEPLGDIEDIIPEPEESGDDKSNGRFKLKGGKFKFGTKQELDESADDGNQDTGDITSIATKLGGSGIAGNIVGGLINGSSTDEEQERKEDTAASVANAEKRANDLKEAIDKGKTVEELKEEKAKARQEEREEENSSVFKQQLEATKSHSKLWSAIFSKNGLITGAVILGMAWLKKNLPSIFDTIINIGKGIAQWLGGSVKDAVQDISWTNEHNARTDGNTMDEQAQKELQDIKDGNILTDENGNATHNTDARLSFLGRTAMNFVNSGHHSPLESKATKVEKGIFNFTKKVGGKIKDSKVVKNIPTTFSNMATIADATAEYGDEAYTLAENAVERVGAKVMNTKPVKSIRNAGKSVATKVTDVADNATGAIKNAGTTVATKISDKAAKNDGLLSKIAGWIDNFLSFVKEKFAKKAGEKAGEKFVDSGFKNGILKALKSKWDDICESLAKKISERLGIGATGAAVSFGITELAFATIGAINGVSGTAKLFQVSADKVDGKMRLIAGIFGALAGTTVGGIIDVILQVVGSIAGTDFLHNLAVGLYNAMVGADSEEAKALENAQVEFKDQYLEDRNETLEKQYETQKKAGIIGDGVTFEQFVAGVEDGTYKASYTSFQDYNTQQNASLGDKAATVVGKAAKGIGKAIKGFYFGNKVEQYQDERGNTYVDNGDGTFKITDKDGNDLGNVSKESVDTSQMTNQTKRTGPAIYARAFDAAKNVGKTIGTGVKTAMGKLNVVDNAKALIEMMKNGDVAGMVKYKAKDEEGEDGNLIQGIPALIMKRILFLPTSFIGLGKKIASGVKFLVEKGKGIANVVKEESEYGKQLLLGDGESHLSDLFKIDDGDPENPVSGFMKPIIFTSRLAGFGSVIVKYLGKKIGATIGKVAGKVKNSIVSLTKFGLENTKLAFTGDVKGLWQNDVTDFDDDENPVGGFTKAIAIADKVVKTPTSAIMWVGKKVAEGFKYVFGKVKNSIVALTKMHISDALLIAKGDVKGLWQNDVKEFDDDENPVGGFTKAIAIAQKVSQTPLATIMWVDRKIVEGFKYVFGKVKNSVTALTKMHISDASLIAKGDVKGLWQNDVKEFDDDENPVGGFTKAIAIAQKVSQTPLASIIWVDRKIVEGVKHVFTKVKNSVAALTKMHLSNSMLALKGDVQGLWKSDVTDFDDDENPVGGFTKAIAIAEKVTQTPLASIMWAGRSLVELIKKPINAIKNFIGQIQPTISLIGNNALTGNFDSVWNTEIVDDPSNPVGGFGKAVITGAKIAYMPLTAVTWAGNIIKGLIQKPINAVKEFSASLAPTISDISEKANNGDISGMWSTEAMDGDGNLLSGFGKAIVVGAKVVNSPTAAVRWAGNLIKDKFNDITENISSNFDSFKKGGEKLTDLTKKGDISAIWKESLNLQSGDPLHGIWSSIFTVQKVISTVGAIPGAIGNAVGNLGKWISEKLNAQGADAAFQNLKTDVQSTAGGRGTNTIGGGSGSGIPNQLNGFPYRSQNDPSVRDIPYKMSPNDNATYGTTGCYPAAMGSVVEKLTGNKVSTQEMGKFAQVTGSRDYTGTNYSYLTDAATAYGLESKGQYNPTAEYISANATPNRPMILSGVDDGTMGSNSPFTPYGHAVTVVGTTNDGRLKINNPLGTEKSGVYDANDIARQTEYGVIYNKTSNKSSGGRGVQRFINRIRGGRGLRKVFGRIRGGRGIDQSKWVQTVKAVKKAIADQKPGYNQSGFITVTLNGESHKVRTDCSGFVCACLQFFGVPLSDHSLWTGIMADSSSPVAKSGFKLEKWSGWDSLSEGDILVNSSHTEIFCRNDGGTHYVYNCGSSKSVNNPDATVTGHSSYNVVWKCGGAAGATVNTSATSDDSSASSSTPTSNSTESAISKMGTVFSNVASAISGAAISGNRDIDWNAVINGTSNTSQSASSTSSATGTGNFPKYSGLTDAELKGLANIIQHEQPGVEGMYAEASQMANLNDKSGDDKATKENLIKLATGGWYAKGKDRYNSGKSGSTSIDSTAFQAAKDVFVEGKRTLPRYVDEHDYFGDIGSLSTGGSVKDRSAYKQHETVISNHMGSKYTFYSFPNSQSDPFGYTDSSLRSKYGEDHYDPPTGGGRGYGGRGTTDPDYYNQQDPRWANMSFGRYNNRRDTVGDGGCGPTTAATVLQKLTGQTITPDETAKFALENGYKYDDGGTDTSFYNAIGSRYGVNFNETAPNSSETIDSLRQGNPVVFLGHDTTGTSPFGNDSHYVVGTGMDRNGNINILDPKNTENNRLYNINDITANATDSIVPRQFVGGRGRFIPSNIKSNNKRLISLNRSLSPTISNGIVKFDNSTTKQLLSSSEFNNSRKFEGYGGRSGKTLIDIALNEVGYKEKSSNSDLDNPSANSGSGNWTKYWRDIDPSYQGQPWCACFVTWCMEKAFGKDNATKLLKHYPFVYCPTLGGLLPLHDTPEPGDIVLFKDSGGTFCHTGLVIAFNSSSNEFTTVEGNTSGQDGSVEANGDGVYKKKYTLGKRSCKFARPDYSIVGGLNAIGSNGSSSSSGTTTATEKKSLVEGLSTIFSEVATRSVNGMVTGEFDTDFSSVLASLAGSTSSSTTSSSGSSVAGIANADLSKLNNDSFLNSDIKTLPHLSEAQIKAVLDKNFVPNTSGTGSSIFTAENSANCAAGIFKAQEETGVSALVSLGIGAWESGWGTSRIAHDKGNLWGWAAYNASPGASATTFGNDTYAAFKGYTNNLVKTYYDGYGAKSIHAIGSGDNPAGKGYAYHDGGGINTEWPKNVTSVAMRMVNSLNGGRGPTTMSFSKKNGGRGGKARPYVYRGINNGRGKSVSDAKAITKTVTSRYPVKYSGGRGAVASSRNPYSNREVSDLQNVLYGTEQIMASQRGSTDNGIVEELLSSIIRVLGVIANNTGELRNDMSNIQTNNINIQDNRTSGGKNVLVSGKQNRADDIQSMLENSVKTSRNQEIANRIAKGD